MPMCSIRQCGSQKNKKWPGLTFHRFPTNEKKKKTWMDAIGVENINLHHNVLWVCSKHFEERHFNRTLDVVRLRDNSAPSLVMVVYSEENKSTFPVELAELCDIVANCLGFEGFRAEAAIVNYYHMGSTLSAHTDHSEVNLEAPLFSFSFGQSAIFLIGGPDKSIEPSAILLNSGDIIVMSKEARLCYHAVPRILPACTQPWNKPEDLIITEKKQPNFKFITEDAAKLLPEIERNIDNEDWSKFNSYVEESRININVRQVLKQNQKSLLDCNTNYIM